jgi:aromatic ring hydroxylase
MGIRSGREFLDSLRGQRKVIHDGVEIDDVTAVPVFRRQAAAIAQFYDFQSEPHLRDLMTFESRDRERCGMAFLEPRSKQDLRRRVAAYAAWAQVSCGLLSRSPDYMNTMLTAMAGLAAAAGDEELSRPVVDYYDMVRQGDLYLTHTFVYPFMDHTKAHGENPTVLRVVREDAEGIVLSGARGLATGAPFANHNVNVEYMRPPSSTMGPDGKPTLSLSFWHDIEQPGVRWLSRDVDTSERRAFDAPVTAFADEIDCVAVYDEARIPWSQVITYANDFEKLARISMLWSQFGEHLTFHQALVRSIEKSRLVLGLAHLMAESSGASKYFNIKQRLADIVLSLDILEAIAVAAVDDAEQDPVTGWYRPKMKHASAGLRYFGECYPKMLDHLVMIGAGRLVSTPSERTLDLLGPALESYFRGSESNARSAVGLYRLAWDLAGSTCGRRQDLYERFFANSFELRRVQAYETMNKSEAIEMVRRLLRAGEASAGPFQVPPRYSAPEG